MTSWSSLFFSPSVLPQSLKLALMEKTAVADSILIGGWFSWKILLPPHPIITPSLTRKILSAPLCLCLSVSADGFQLWVHFQFCLRSREQPTKWLRCQTDCPNRLNVFSVLHSVLWEDLFRDTVRPLYGLLVHLCLLMTKESLLSSSDQGAEVYGISESWLNTHLYRLCATSD